MSLQRFYLEEFLEELKKLYIRVKEGVGSDMPDEEKEDLLRAIEGLILEIRIVVWETKYEG